LENPWGETGKGGPDPGGKKKIRKGRSEKMSESARRDILEDAPEETHTPFKRRGETRNNEEKRRFKKFVRDRFGSLADLKRVIKK